MTAAFKTTDLFGGAIKVNIPGAFVDVSNIRQVPDNQEVYLDQYGFASLTFDIAERVSHLSNDKAALEYHFGDIVAETDSNKVWSVHEHVELPNFPTTTPILALTAVIETPTSIATADALTPDHTTIRFTLIRLVEQSTDIVITLNTPHLDVETLGQQLSGTEAEGQLRKTEQEADNMYHQIVMSFAINDWGLFSGD